LIDAMPFSIAYADCDLRYRAANRRFEELNKRTRGEVEGKHIRDIAGREHFERVRPYLEQVMAGKEVKYELDDVDSHGGVHRIEALYLPHFAADGSTLGHFSIVQDVTERERNEALLQYLASHDQLTRLPNRNRFLEQLTAEIARAARYEYKLGVLFIDLDRFKNVNDTLGHDFGDSLLIAVAERFRATLREVDMVARLGGDEFTAILSEIKNPQEAAASAQRLLNSLKTPIVINGQEIFAGASIGISLFPDNGTDTKILLRNADVAMYRAKEMGKNTFQFFSQEITASSVERLVLENNLRRAAERGEFVLHYQPIVDLESLRIVGMESLIRWDSPNAGPVPPGTFIPLAEESGLIVPIGEWVLETACRAAHAFHQQGHAGLRIAVNLSPKQFRHRDLAQTIADTLARTGLAARHLELEITESSVMENPDAAVRTMHALKEMGVHLSIDDFGTGYSSLSQLKRFPITTLKVDQSFVKDIPADEDNAAIASAIIAMGQRLRLVLVAEGVETTEQMAFLRERGCQYAQGYLFSRPMPGDQLGALLATGVDRPLP
jgi:diguanylate cyclase (GGDEF)-like protein/PAS domain S-box-containing protein